MATPGTTGGDRGESLIEVIISAALITLLFAGVLGGIASGSTLTDAHRANTNADIALKAAAEAIKAMDAADLQYESTADSAVAGVVLDGSAEATVSSPSCAPALTAEQYLSGAAFDLTFPSAGTCPGSGRTLERLTVTVVTTTARGSMTETTEVVVRKVRS